ncbi:hypothetical protein FDP41_004767 [Naegleria fowleri]|uniref:Serpin domain-containing protein n=1 Tax=Naegleria fowleri TaxID=5763 RepID=A0A6A5BPB9_NAEFO|nr:uncharacterized protein FDP41_004767 [Naegleria fowleri]KAF0976091.1 hypothetical protein FDP41_004767 [Naegleria fowleri]
MTLKTSSTTCCIIVTLFSTIVLILLLSCEFNLASPSSLIQTIQNSQKSFSAHLFQSLSQPPTSSQQPQQQISTPSNVVFSPFSIFMVLSMMLVGAQGHTQLELAHALTLDYYQRQGSQVFNFNPHGDFATSMSQLIDHSVNSSELSVANGIFTEQSFKLSSSYMDTISNDFHSQLKSCDFVHHAEPERRSINQWVSNRTKNLINDLIPIGAITADTKLVLVNAIYFLGKWRIPFDKEDSFTGTFSQLKKSQDDTSSTLTVESVNVQYMSRHQVREFFGQNEKYKWLRRQYSSQDFEMLFIVPKTSISLSEQSEKEFEEWVSHQISLNAFPVTNSSEGSLTVKTLSQAFDTSSLMLRLVQIPKFKIEYENELSNVLKQAPFNMTTSFEKLKANFTNMLSKVSILREDRLWIDKIFHKAYLKVDEQGTEAAAATAGIIVGRTTSIDIEPEIDFVLDRPFAFVLSHVPTQSVLFMGKVNHLVSVSSS